MLWAQNNVELPITILDVPFQGSHGRYSFPSMQQSLDLTYSFQRTAVWGIHKFAYSTFLNENVAQGIGLVIVGSSSFFIGMSAGWMHEEWHRAVLTNQNISSRNGFYYPEEWSNGLISVDSVQDQDLTRLKSKHPEETVRLMSAGIESQIALIGKQSDMLFLQHSKNISDKILVQQNSFMAPIIAMNQISTLLYLNTCLNESNNELTDEENQRTIQMKTRDFTGLDCTAWVYDMHRPDEPYESRGQHPYGEGIDRYRSLEDLRNSEIQFLQETRWIHLINFLNPHMIGIHGIHSKKGRWNFRMASTLTPFGYTIDGNIALYYKEKNSLVLLRIHRFHRGYSPELGLRMFHIPMQKNLQLDAGGEVWFQPENLRWDDDTTQLGGAVWSQIHWKLTPKLHVWMQINMKTQGWMSGEVYLDPNISTRIGMSFFLEDS